MFKAWQSLDGEDPFIGWKKLEVKSQQKILYERQVGPFRLHILHRHSDDQIYLSFKVSDTDFSICDQPTTPQEIKTILDGWQRRGKLDSPKEIEQLHSVISKTSANGSTT